MAQYFFTFRVLIAVFWYKALIDLQYAPRKLSYQLQRRKARAKIIDRSAYVAFMQTINDVFKLIKINICTGFSKFYL